MNVMTIVKFPGLVSELLNLNHGFWILGRVIKLYYPEFKIHVDSSSSLLTGGAASYQLNLAICFPNIKGRLNRLFFFLIHNKRMNFYMSHQDGFKSTSLYSENTSIDPQSTTPLGYLFWYFATFSLSCFECNIHHYWS